jgi:hypothetical protein
MIKAWPQKSRQFNGGYASGRRFAASRALEREMLYTLALITATVISGGFSKQETTKSDRISDGQHKNLLDSHSCPIAHVESVIVISIDALTRSQNLSTD